MLHARFPMGVLIHGGSSFCFDSRWFVLAPIVMRFIQQTLLYHIRRVLQGETLAQGRPG